MSTSKTKDKYQIAVVPGDGIGKEVMEAAIHVLDALDIDFDYVYGQAGDECLEKTGSALPDETLEIQMLVYLVQQEKVQQTLLLKYAKK